jgi:hypothetical protein
VDRPGASGPVHPAETSRSRPLVETPTPTLTSGGRVRCASL